MDNQLRCDFCGTDAVLWGYPLMHTNEPFFTERGVIHGEPRDWAACDFCSSMVECEDTMGLETRAINAWKLATGSINRLPGDHMEVQFKYVVEGLFSMFWARRTGARYLLRRE
jgi:hypothetical protein